MRPVTSRQSSLFAAAPAAAVAMIGLVLTTPATATGLDQYPERLIKIVVPVPAGTVPDTFGRIVADKLQSKWGKPVIVENRPGAALNIGTEAVAKAEPDGYTLLVAPTGPLVINQHLYNLRFDPMALVPITVIAAAPNVLVVRPGLGVGSVPELIALAKSQPGKLTYASTGRGTTMHLTAEMLKSHAGFEIAHVAYKGIPQYLNDMLGGNIDLAFANLIDVFPLLQDGRLKAIAVGSTERIALLRNVPALAETIPGFVSTAWYAVAAPPKTPPQIVQKLSSALIEGLKEPASMARLEGIKATPVLNSPSEAAAFFREESARWRKVIVAAGIKPE